MPRGGHVTRNMDLTNIQSQAEPIRIDQQLLQCSSAKSCREGDCSQPADARREPSPQSACVYFFRLISSAIAMSMLALNFNARAFSAEKPKSRKTSPLVTWVGLFLWSPFACFLSSFIRFRTRDKRSFATLRSRLPVFLLCFSKAMKNVDPRFQSSKY